MALSSVGAVRRNSIFHTFVVWRIVSPWPACWFLSLCWKAMVMEQIKSITLQSLSSVTTCYHSSTICVAESATVVLSLRGGQFAVSDRGFSQPWDVHNSSSAHGPLMLCFPTGRLAMSAVASWMFCRRRKWPISSITSRLRRPTLKRFG